ncbi:hypothetical protein BH10ACI3_BH10ACI3_05070 [soil metagenome]
MFALGDAIGRRYFPFASMAHRLASAFLCGLLFSSWWTYILAFLFASSPSPMFWGNALFFITAIGMIVWLHRNPTVKVPEPLIDLSDADFVRWDWIIAGIFLLFATWMMFRTFTMGDGNIMIGHHQFPDFGSTVSIMQSFAEGHNFPTQYPHFTGERIRYHFLFYFQAGNLEYLGLSPAMANNVLSIFSLTSLLILVMTLGGILFRSRIAGRIGAALFFFHGSLSFIPFLQEQASFSALLDKLNTMTPYLRSGFPYRGEDWGVWSQNVYLNQRHLTSSIAIFLLVLIYLTIKYRENAELAPESSTEVAAVTERSETESLTAPDESGDDSVSEAEGGPEPVDADPDVVEADGNDETDDETDDETNSEDNDDDGPDLIAIVKKYSVYIFCGLLLGLLPMWNGAIFLGAAAVLAALFILFPLRRELVALAITSAIVSLPQIIYLKTGNVRPVGYSMLRWGFVIDNAGITDVLYYTFFTFGFKWVLLAIALYFASGLQRRFIAAVSILLPLTYCFRFSEEVLANHKFINMWLIVVNIFCGYALVKLWTLKGPINIPARIIGIILLLLVTIGGAIDLMPVKNSYFINMKYDDDKLIQWVKGNTDPKAIFLSHRYINHQILLAGRRLFYGDPYYAWGADYDTAARDGIVRTMFESKDPAEVYRLLKENNINYVAIDDMIRKGQLFIKSPNEELYAKYFELVFVDDINEYANIRIYKVPDTFSAPATNQLPQQNPASPENPAASGVNAFLGVEGNQPGQFSKPRGVATDGKGFIYIADTMNARVQKFTSDGSFISAFGDPGTGAGQMKEPNGVAIDAAGNIFVTDSINHKLMKFRADGQFVKEWRGPNGGFYGPRDLVFGPNKLLYIIDQGGTRIAKFDPSTEEFTTWGDAGAGEGQFNEPTGIAIGNNMVFVADTGNHRVQTFDLDGKFVRQWDVQIWDPTAHQYPDIVYDEVSKRLLISSGSSNEVLAFDLDGRPSTGFKPEAEAALDNPSSMVILENGKQRRLLILNTGKDRLSSIELEAKKAK